MCSICIWLNVQVHIRVRCICVQISDITQIIDTAILIGRSIYALKYLELNSVVHYRVIMHFFGSCTYLYKVSLQKCVAVVNKNQQTEKGILGIG